MHHDNNKNNQTNVVSGVAFDDLTVAEMAEVQGAGDMEGETTTPVCVAISTAYASIHITKTFKGKC